MSSPPPLTSIPPFPCLAKDPGDANFPVAMDAVLPGGPSVPTAEASACSPRLFPVRWPFGPKNCIGITGRSEEAVSVGLSPSAAPSRRRHVIFRNRSLAVLVGGQWVSQIGNNLFELAIYWYVLNVTHQPSMLGWVGTAVALPGVLGLVSGVLVDRVDRRKTMMASDLIRAILSFTIALLAWLGNLSLWALLSLIFLLAAAGTVFQPASAALLPSVVEREDLAQANGVSNASLSVAGMVGSAAGGALMALLGPLLLFLLKAASFLLSVFSLGLIRTPAPPRVEHPSGIRGLVSEWSEGLASVRRDGFLLAVIGTAVLVNFCSQNVNVLMAAWVKGPLHGSALSYGMMDVATLVGAIAGSLLAASLLKRLGPSRLVTVSIMMIGLMIAVFSRISNIVGAAAPLPVAGFFEGLATVDGNVDIHPLVNYS